MGGIMNELEILREIEARGVVLKTDGHQIYYRPKTALPNELKDRLREHKASIVRFLQSKRSSVTVFSKVLKKEIEISWIENDPKIVYVSRVRYTADELSKLKDAGPEGVKAAHIIKEIFHGKILHLGYR
jgi:hypothetical protein